MSKSEQQPIVEVLEVGPLLPQTFGPPMPAEEFPVNAADLVDFVRPLFVPKEFEGGDVNDE